MQPITTNRETWLNAITSQFIRPHFEKAGYTIPDNIRMSCAFSTKGAHTKSHQKTFVMGQCISPRASGDNHHEIIIVPSLSESIDVVGTLIHELCHATVNGDHASHGHDHVFKQCANAVGLVGKMTSTGESEELKALILEWVNELGQYPHASLDVKLRKQTTRMYKTVCRNGGCGYTMRISSKWLKVAVPACPACNSTMESPFGQTDWWANGDDGEE
jgi:hypothetical protein